MLLLVLDVPQTSGGGRVDKSGVGTENENGKDIIGYVNKLVVSLRTCFWIWHSGSH